MCMSGTTIGGPGTSAQGECSFTVQLTNQLTYSLVFLTRMQDITRCMTDSDDKQYGMFMWYVVHLSDRFPMRADVCAGKYDLCLKRELLEGSCLM